MATFNFVEESKSAQHQHHIVNNGSTPKGQMLPRVATNVLAKADLPVVISEEPNGTSNVFVPVYADESISMDLLAQILSDSAELFKEGFNGHATNFNMQTHLAIVESDSTVVYYKTALGISVATPSSDIYLT
ncbi:hypothetical protein GGI26_004249 [Coemansia sp. RSA 1358]|nr:hypothetical protein GGI26_004249 [Coemansia sp. RSA 1358]